MLHTLKQKTKVDETVFSDRKRRIYAFLKSCPVGVISTVNSQNNPHGTVIYFDINKEFTITFLTRTRTKKHDNILHNNAVMLTVFDAATQTTAQITGVATEIQDGYDVNGIAGNIFARSLRLNKVGLMPINKLDAGPYVAFVIQPEQIRMAVYSRPDPGDYDKIFESIESFDLHN